MPKRSYSFVSPPLLAELRAAADQSDLRPFTDELTRFLEVAIPPHLLTDQCS